MTVTPADTAPADPCALCRRGDTPLQLSLITRLPTGDYRTGWACATCAARYPEYAALVLALFHALSGEPPAGPCGGVRA